MKDTTLTPHEYDILLDLLQNELWTIKNNSSITLKEKTNQIKTIKNLIKNIDYLL